MNISSLNNGKTGIYKKVMEKIVSIEAIRNSGLAGLAGGLRRILFDSFKDTSNLKRGEQGRFLLYS